MIKLDDRDIRMLSILCTDGRISKTELASRVNLSPTPCGERLKRLEKAGIIESYRARVSLRKIAPHVVVFMLAELENHREETFAAFEGAMADFPEITGCWALGGGFDYLLQVISRDIDAYQKFVDELLSRKAGLARYFTYVVTKPVKDTGELPFGSLLP